MRYKNPYDDSQVEHLDIHDEMLFVHHIVEGDISYVSDVFNRKKFRQSESLNRLSKDPVTNLKYHFVTITALISRFCISYGMKQELALSMNDFYISGLDSVSDELKMEEFFKGMVLDFTKRMNILNKKKLSKNVTDAAEYIRIHTGDAITLNSVADALGLSPGHLSRVFRKEMNISLVDYIRKRKIDAAKDMLFSTNLSIMEISCQLSFSSQSHFIQVFREETGMTPGKYRVHYGSIKSDPLNLLQ